MKRQGDERFTETYKAGGQERPVTDASRAHGPEVEQAGGTLAELSYAAGCTISLGNYEFVRIQIGARAAHPAQEPEAYDAAYDALRVFVAEVLAREEALVRRTQREDAPLPPLAGVNRAVWVEYGMTLNAAVKFESHKIDLGLSRPLGDGEDAAQAMAALQAYLAQRVLAERDRLRGGGA